MVTYKEAWQITLKEEPTITIGREGFWKACKRFEEEYYKKTKERRLLFSNARELNSDLSLIKGYLKSRPEKKVNLARAHERFIFIRDLEQSGETLTGRRLIHLCELGNVVSGTTIRDRAKKYFGTFDSKKEYCLKEIKKLVLGEILDS